MEKVWYYAVATEQKGPVTGEELLALEGVGVVQSSTLVWKAGMTRWEPWSSVAAGVRTGAGHAEGVRLMGGAATEEVGVCAYSGQTRPLSLMVKYGDRWVSLEHKDAFLQALREGAAVSRMAGVGETQYVGFWWRVLSMIVDVLVLLLPNLVVAAPYYYLLTKQMLSRPPTMSLDPLHQFKTMDTPMIVAYVFMTVGSLVIPLIYEAWMLPKYGGTVGKLVIGAKVTRVGGERLTWLQALGRAGAKLLNTLIWVMPASVAVVVGSLTSFGTGAATPGTQEVPVAFLVGLALMFIWYVVGGFGYYMAGWTRRKQALHDKMARTLVVKKNPV